MNYNTNDSVVPTFQKIFHEVRSGQII